VSGGYSSWGATVRKSASSKKFDLERFNLKNCTIWKLKTKKQLFNFGKL
jgi:hypothetical protein